MGVSNIEKSKLLSAVITMALALGMYQEHQKAIGGFWKKDLFQKINLNRLDSQIVGKRDRPSRGSRGKCKQFNTKKDQNEVY